MGEAAGPQGEGWDEEEATGPVKLRESETQKHPLQQCWEGNGAGHRATIWKHEWGFLPPGSEGLGCNGKKKGKSTCLIKYKDLEKIKAASLGTEAPEQKLQNLF